MHLHGSAGQRIDKHWFSWSKGWQTVAQLEQGAAKQASAAVERLTMAQLEKGWTEKASAEEGRKNQ